MVTLIITPLMPQAAKCVLTQAAMQLGQGSVGGASADFGELLKLRGAVVSAPEAGRVESGPSFSESPVCLVCKGHRIGGLCEVQVG